jgi:hypothetical protein
MLFGKTIQKARRCGMCDDILVVNFKDFGSQEALDAAFGDRWLYIGRQNQYAGVGTSPLANPFRAAAYGGRGATLPYYRKWLWQQIQDGNPVVLQTLQEIGQTAVLVCWCKPEPCHGDVVRKAALWVQRDRYVWVTTRFGRPDLRRR